MPTFNEAGNINHAIQELFQYNKSVDLLIVDDDSPDGTGKLADQLASTNSQITVMHRKEKQGLGADVVEMDADGSHRAEDLPKLLAVSELNDLVIGSRYVKGGSTENWPLHRQWLSKGGNLFAKMMLGTRLNDMTAGFRVFNVPFLKTMDLESINARGYSFQIEMAYRTIQQGGRVTEVPIVFIEREVGESKMSRAIVIEALVLMTKFGMRRLFRRS
ncbi:MAG: hypothetical protein RLZZ218_1055 [Actinomycetota bacterium]